MASIVYALSLTSDPSNYRYIGRTSNRISSRLSEHIAQSRERKTHNHRWIQKATSNGETIQITLLEGNLTFEQSSIREIALIKHYREQGYRLTNATLGGEGALGRPMSPRNRAKIIAANTGRIPSQQTREKWSLSRRGRILTPEHIANAVAGRKGYSPTPATRAKISASNVGKTHTPATRAKLSLAMTGNTNPLGSKHTQATKDKMSLARTGKTLSPESIAKREATKKRLREERKNLGGIK